MRSLIGSILLSLCIAVSLEAKAPGSRGDEPVDLPSPENLAVQSEPDVSFGLYGRPSGRRTSITLTIGNNVSRSVKVFAEPSHTLLVAFADAAETDPREQEWYRELPRGGRMLLPFGPGRRATFEADAAPISDTHLAVHVYARYPDQDGPRERVFVAHVALRDFGFRFQQTGTDAVICCEKDPDQPRNPCTTGCNKCPAGVNEFTCCTTRDEQETCGWCNKVKALCGTVLCPGCG